MNDSEAACFGAEALEYHCSFATLYDWLCDRQNSDFDIFIQILFYLNNKWREDARNSLDLDMVLLTQNNYR